MGLAVVAHEDDDRRVCQAVGLELPEDQADFAVELAGRVQVLGPILPGNRVVGIIGRNDHLGRVGSLGGVKGPVRLLEVHLGEEGPVSLQVVPAVGIECIVVRREIPVGLAGPRETDGGGELADIGRDVARLRIRSVINRTPAVSR